MRITSIGNIIDTYKVQKSTATENKKPTKGKDVLDISSTAKEYQIAQKAISQVPDIRMDKVQEIKSKIESKTYNIDANQIADKIVSSIFDLKA